MKWVSDTENQAFKEASMKAPLEGHAALLIKAR
jgi:hypothetical protein